VTVTLNRVWNIDHTSSCGSTTSSPEGGASSYTVTAVFDADFDGNPDPPFSCDITVSTSAPDGAVTNDIREIPVTVE
jgi:hypothetical protein